MAGVLKKVELLEYLALIISACTVIVPKAAVQQPGNLVM
jgi:hypothetical protein